MNWRAFIRRILLAILIFFLICISLLIAFRIAWYFPINPAADGFSNPDFSPDGKLIAFECIYKVKEDIATLGRDGYSSDDIRKDICISNIDGSEYQRITTSRFMNFPTWSPSGKSLAWIGQRNSIYIRDTQSGKISHYRSNDKFNADFFGDCVYITWSSDESRVFLEGIGIIFNIPTESFIKMPSSIETKYISCPTLSTDGRYLAGIEMNDDSGLNFILRVYENGKLVFENNEHPDITRMSWSEDNTSLIWAAYPRNLFSRNSVIEESLYIANIPSGITQKIPITYDDYITINNPQFSDNDQRLSFGSFEDIYWVDIELTDSPFSTINKGQHKIKSKGLFFPYSVSWSPDGKLVAYTTEKSLIQIFNLTGQSYILADMYQTSWRTPIDLLQVLVMSLSK
jgi:hypothetical protein